MLKQTGGEDRPVQYNSEERLLAAGGDISLFGPLQKKKGNAGRVKLGRGFENRVGSCLSDSDKKRVPNLYACTFV